MIKSYRPSDLKDVEEQRGLWQEITAEPAKRLKERHDRAAFDLMYGAEDWYEKDGVRVRPVGGGAPYFVQTLQYMTAAVTANTFTTAQTIIGTGEAGPMNVDYFKTIGAAWKQEAFGIISTTVTPTIAFGTYYGVVAATITTNLCITPTVTTASGLANINWYWLAMSRTVAVTSTTATMLTTGILFGDIEVLGTTVATEPQQWAVNATPPTAVTTDLSSNVFITLKATWGTSSVSNTITTNFYTLTSVYA